MNRNVVAGTGLTLVYFIKMQTFPGGGKLITKHKQFAVA